MFHSRFQTVKICIKTTTVNEKLSFFSRACVFSHHINQLGDLQSKTHFNGVISPLDGSDPALVALEEVSEEGVLHLRQGHKLALG